MVEKAVYVDWRDNQVTQEWRKAVQQGVEAVVSKLVTDRDLDQSQTQYYRGWVRGMVECLEWEPDFSEGEQDD